MTTDSYFALAITAMTAMIALFFVARAMRPLRRAPVRHRAHRAEVLRGR
jgi:hypothetical protein